jgi:tRNA(His) 5'-end guanylyltransferase
MAAHAVLGHSATMNKSGEEKQEMLFQEKGVNWNDYPTKYKRGTVIKKQNIFVEGQNGEQVQRSKWVPDYNIPIFTQDREYLMSLIPKSEIITE